MTAAAAWSGVVRARCAACAPKACARSCCARCRPRRRRRRLRAGLCAVGDGAGRRLSQPALRLPAELADAAPPAARATGRAAVETASSARPRPRAARPGRTRSACRTTSTCTTMPGSARASPWSAATGRYCGEPEPRLRRLRRRCGQHSRRRSPSPPCAPARPRFLRGRARVVVPSRRRRGAAAPVFPRARAAASSRRGRCRPAAAAAAAGAGAASARVCVVGAIGVEKGYDVLLACARDAARRAAAARIRRGRPHHRRSRAARHRPRVRHRALRGGRGGGADPRRRAPISRLLPSIWPETWCFALDRGLARRAARRGVRHRRAGRAHPPHRPRLAAAARPACRRRSTTRCLRLAPLQAMNARCPAVRDTSPRTRPAQPPSMNSEIPNVRSRQRAPPPSRQPPPQRQSSPS